MISISQTAHETHKALQEKAVSSRELVTSFYHRIDSLEGRLNAYNTLTKKQALAQADLADQALANGGPIGPLTGIPIALKDNLCTEGVLTTCSSKILANFVPPYDATVVSKLRKAGAVFLGKTNLDEFAMGSSTENSAFEATKNPWDLSCIPGGSSGGSATAVAADETVLALGSDTGGSIRQPAACCGVVGLKPTYGRVSRYGLIAFASSLDQIGPLTHDVTDAATLFQVIGGYDPRDSTSADVPMPNMREGLDGGVQGLRLGIPKEYFIEGVDSEVASAIEKAIDEYRRLGAKIQEISLPHTGYAIATYYILATAEASSNLARYDGVRYGHRSEAPVNLLELYTKSRREGFGPEVKRRIMIGTHALSSGYYDAYYKKAQQVRTLIKNDFDEAFKTVDAILTPTMPTPAFRFGEKTEDPLQMYLSDIFTISVNLAGIPAISLPCGFTTGGLPIGLQVIGKPFGEAEILQIAYAYEQQHDFHKRRPTIGE
ncbi:MAG: Asp-tRNA(Asn)/Glu-tRNA(Gln) amidotransferase subunit GatA [Nitrospira sp.]|nr:Asp-tRNA(Asn)/Glu-tRNA(Gln) amidotransferase subunit GatA [Candidatus Manganitrophaceae bacterium]HIL34453.1 Asp-tRNA(Asn)/Glu-tRNA(Gln) amidotransferase subunit GatA [Candidatus Manganitrophaceae bacterium]